MIISQHTQPLANYLGHQESLELHPTDLEDASFIYPWLDNPLVARYSSGVLISHMMVLQDFKERMAHEWDAKNKHAWTIRMADNTPVGYMSVLRRQGKDEVRWGFSVIGPDDMRGKGYGSVAKRLVLDHLFSLPDVQRVITWVHRDNAASRRFNERCGAQIIEDQRYRKTLKLEITRTTWHDAFRTPN